MPENKVTEKSLPKTSPEVEANAPGKADIHPPPPLPEGKRTKEYVTQQSALEACQAAGIKKLFIEVDVETALKSAESAKGSSVQIKAQVGKAFVPVGGRDLLETIQLAAVRAKAHPPEQGKNDRTFSGDDPTAADRRIASGG